MRRESRSSWSAVERRANNELKRGSAIQGLGALVLVCVGVGLGLKVVAGVKNIEEEQRKMYEEGLNNQACTGEVVDKTYTPEHEELSLIGRTPVLSKVPENRTITMQLGAGCRPYEAGDKIEISTDSQLWDKADNGDMLYHPGGSTDWDVHDNLWMVRPAQRRVIQWIITAMMSLSEICQLSVLVRQAQLQLGRNIPSQLPANSILALKHWKKQQAISTVVIAASCFRRRLSARSWL